MSVCDWRDVAGEFLGVGFVIVVVGGVIDPVHTQNEFTQSMHAAIRDRPLRYSPGL